MGGRPVGGPACSCCWVARARFQNFWISWFPTKSKNKIRDWKPASYRQTGQLGKL
jgi:hypothetical protein